MEHQQAISTARLLTRIGREIAVLINESGDDGIVGRPSADAPYFQPNTPPPTPFTIGLGTVRAEAGRQLA